jgi:hypothetical protein
MRRNTGLRDVSGRALLVVRVQVAKSGAAPDSAGSPAPGTFKRRLTRAPERSRDRGLFTVQIETAREGRRAGATPMRRPPRRAGGLGRA